MTRDEPGGGWQHLGKKTTARGLDLKFDHDDDPWAEAILLAPGVGEPRRNTLAHRLTVRLGSDFATHHVHTSGYAFRVRLRGTGLVVGKEVLIMMKVDRDGSPYGATIENDDDTDAAVGDWIEIEWAEILRVRNR